MKAVGLVIGALPVCAAFGVVSNPSHSAVWLRASRAPGVGEREHPEPNLPHSSFDRGLKGSLFHYATLENTTVGKPGRLAATAVSAQCCSKTSMMNCAFAGEFLLLAAPTRLLCGKKKAWERSIA
eukprot:gnl/TRDRNA2_/TRDRNA2_172816_c0_seq1.p1 gnl/TRDRNA2_/TRDRNA2_172816_c0~~gnl/TRDRNA2_/TRDRNA2_172816_c0_seq1.p1  ORF type:complete len:125 (-),score=17.51 gnl/TRDRNA2_/TRDRNA2_172816_c0_seq1:468-842(-)